MVAALDTDIACFISSVNKSGEPDTLYYSREVTAQKSLNSFEEDTGTRRKRDTGTGGHGDNLSASPRLPLWSVFFCRVTASPTLERPLRSQEQHIQKFRRYFPPTAFNFENPDVKANN
jgi:hypothetical protein